MSQSLDKILIDKDVMRSYFTELLIRRGINEDDAKITIDVLLEADLRGVDSHGVLRLSVYLERLDRGLLSKENRIEVIEENDVFSIIDGGNYLGPVAANMSMEKAIRKAEEGIVGLGLVRNNHHYGACSYYSLKASKEGMIGFTTSNTVPLMAPTGGKKRIVGNNPFSFAAPSRSYGDFVIDIAVSNVAAGKILLARKKGEDIPVGWALDKEGNNTTNAYDGFEGGGLLLPIGNHKGYGMAVMFDILSGVLTGSAFGEKVKALQDYSTTEPLGTGHFMMAINIDKIIGIDNFMSRMDDLLSEIKNSPKIDGVNEIFIPGEIENNVYLDRSKNGIPVSKNIIYDINSLGKTVGMNSII